MKRRELPVSTTVGDAYRVVRRIGEGARGTVFEARDLRRNQPCALKLMDGVIAESAEALATFHSQAEIASRPLHPGLLPVLDFGTAGTGEPFVITEFLEGEDVGARLRRRPGSGNSVRFEAPLVGHLIQQAAQALSVAHKHGLYHLGLKPTNLFLVPQPDGPDQLQVLDFGLSQVVNALHLEGPARLDDSLPYVSPEQSGGRSDPLDDRCDQWSLACVAWQMLAGRPPFTGPDAVALLYQVGFEDPQIDPGASIPDTVLAVLDRALSKKAEDRFPDILEFGTALEAACGPLPMARKPRRRQTASGAPARSSVFLPGMTPRTDRAAPPSRAPGGDTPAGTACPPARRGRPGGRGAHAPGGGVATSSRHGLAAAAARRHDAGGVARGPLAAAGPAPGGDRSPPPGAVRGPARGGRHPGHGHLGRPPPPHATSHGRTRHAPDDRPLKSSATSTAMKRSRKRARRSRSRKRVAD